MKTDDGAQVTVYRPNQRHELGLLRTWVIMVRNVVESRELIWQLFKRDFFAQYKKSFVGIAWVFLMPLIVSVNWVILKHASILAPGKMEAGGPPYTVYLLVGTTMWGLFASTFTGASQTLLAGQTLVMQVNYRHEALLFQQVAQALARFTISLCFIAVMLLAFKIAILHTEPVGELGRPLTDVGRWAQDFPSWRIVLLPVVLLPLMLFTAGVGLLVSMLAVVVVDVTRLLDRMLALLMMFSPIIYVYTPMDQIEKGNAWQLMLHYANKFNPLTYLVCSARDILLYGRVYDNMGFAICSVLAVVVFLVSWRLFFVSEDRLIERMI